MADVAFDAGEGDQDQVAIAVRAVFQSGRFSVGSIVLSQEGADANKAPGLKAATADSTHTENAPAVALFKGVEISTGEEKQTVTGLAITVSDLKDGGDEILRIGSRDIPLTQSIGEMTATSGMVYFVAVNGGTATITMVFDNLSVDDAEALIEGITYRNASDAPTGASRTVTLTSISDNGGTANGGVDTTDLTISSTVTVVAVNDAPVLSGATPALTPINSHQINNAGQTVASIVGNTISDVDAAAVEGIAVSGLSGSHGTWQFSTNAGGTWSDMGVVSNAAALLLRATDFVRFVPDGQASTDASLSYQAWDQTGDTAGQQGAKADATSAGGTTAFSAATDTATIAVNSVPRVTSVTAVSDGSYNIDKTVSLEVAFSENVVVSDGVPTLQLETGLIDRLAVYESGSGSKTLTFTYTVEAGDVSADLDYGTAAALGLGGGKIVSQAAGVTAAIALPTPGGPGSLAETSSVVIDGITPTIVSVSVPANATYGVGNNLDFTVKLSEAVVVSGTPRIGITLDTGGLVYADYLMGSETDKVTFRFTVTAGLRDADGITLATGIDLHGGTLADLAGNQVTDLNLVGVPLLSNIRVDSVVPVDPGDGGGGGGGVVDPEPTTPNSGTVIDGSPSTDGTPVEVTGGDGIDEVRIAGSVVLGTGLENAVLTGTGDFSVQGNALDNILYGNAGDNTIFISGGNDFIDGGLGNNTVVFDGPAANYSVSIVRGVAQVTNLATGDVSTIANVSTLEFADGSQPLFATGQALVSGFYQAFLGRPLDQAGFEFWMGQSLEGAGPWEIVQHFVNAPEFTERTASLSPEELVRSLYADLLQRPEDSAGQAYWIAAIADGMSYGEVAANFVLSEEVGTRIDELFNRNDWLGIA